MLCLNAFKEVDVFKNLSWLFQMRDQYMIKLLNLDLLFVKGALVFDSSNM